MGIIRKIAFFLLLLLCAAVPAAAEFDDMEDMDYWYEQVCVLSEDIGVRYVGSEGEELAQAYLVSAFEELGFSMEDGTINEHFVTNSNAMSVEAILPAQDENAGVIIVCAHYDSAYAMNGDEIPGTRDNASGVAGMLAMAREFAAMPTRPSAEMRFVAFTSEETGHQGSLEYAASLPSEVQDRIIGVFNLDLITVDMWLTDHVFSVDTKGMCTENGYADGTEEAPACNKVVRAILAAMEELQYFDPAENGITHCVPRHMGMSDHESFHIIGVDAANIAFRGNEEEGGNWHPYMHSADDTLGDLDYERTYQALNIVYTALENLARDPAYGD